MLVMLREQPDDDKIDRDNTHSSHPESHHFSLTSPNMTTTQTSNTLHLPPLLALPVELKLQIFSYLRMICNRP